jgi:cobalt-precorrin 5A hydrolase
MKTGIGIWILRSEVEEIGRYLAAKLEAECYLPDEGREITERERFRACFHRHRQWVLVMAAGIAVRYLQGLAVDKHTDPAVVVLDEGCRFAVSLLSGHEGGANQLAYQVANLTGAIPVVTTATEALKSLVIGIGCRRGATIDQIHSAIEHALNSVQQSLSHVREIATIDLKKDEPGLNQWCERSGIPLRTISRDLVRRRPWVTKASEWVKENVGVDGVCEPCALLATFHGQLLLPKTVHEGVAIAIVAEFVRSSFSMTSDKL